MTSLCTGGLRSGHCSLLCCLQFCACRSQDCRAMATALFGDLYWWRVVNIGRPLTMVLFDDYLALTFYDPQWKNYGAYDYNIPYWRRRIVNTTYMAPSGMIWWLFCVLVPYGSQWNNSCCSIFWLHLYALVASALITVFGLRHGHFLNYDHWNNVWSLKQMRFFLSTVLIKYGPQPENSDQGHFCWYWWCTVYGERFPATSLFGDSLQSW